MVPRIELAATSDLKDFHGNDQDEDRARSWSTAVKTAFTRDQAPEDEKCLVFGGLLTGPAQNWYRQLGRSARSSWKDLLQEFRCSSVVRERQLLANTTMRRRGQDGPHKVQKEHVQHYIETLDEPKLAD
uniref:Retrotransposon gag domain-containing protein n=1 Tax=Peronospora matthiolae TaxID=2874970 RepID=A0AAV1UW49_9STRA